MTELNVGGDNNRIAGRDFHEHHYIPSEEPAVPMLPAQKQRIHELIDEYAVISGKEKSHAWKLIHAKVDVCSVNQITTKKYHQAVEFLEENIASARAVKDRKQLISRVLRITEDKTAERDVFCLSHFGSTTLNSLDAEQLVTIYRHFSGANQPPHRPITWEVLIKERGGMVFLIFFAGVIAGMILK